jgi:hypothetical protein
LNFGSDKDEDEEKDSYNNSKDEQFESASKN